MSLVYEPLQRYARRRCDWTTAEDLVAETLLVLWRRLDDVPVGAEIPWAYRTAGHCLSNARRGARRQRQLLARIRTEPTPGVLEAELPDPDLHRALGKLRATDQELLRLWAWEQLTPAEIALVVGLTPNAVSIRLHRAKGHLAEALGARKDQGSPGHEHVEDQEQMP